MQMIRPGRVQNQPVRRIDGHDRRDTVLEPQGQLFQPQPVALGIGVYQHQIGIERLGLGHRCAGTQPQLAGGEIDRRDNPSSSFTPGQRQWRLRRWRVFAQPLPDPVCRPERQVKRDDPRSGCMGRASLWHHRPPLQSQHIRLRGHG